MLDSLDATLRLRIGNMLFFSPNNWRINQSIYAYLKNFSEKWGKELHFSREVLPWISVYVTSLNSPFSRQTHQIWRLKIQIIIAFAIIFCLIILFKIPTIPDMHLTPSWMSAELWNLAHVFSFESEEGEGRHSEGITVYMSPGIGTGLLPGEFLRLGICVEWPGTAGWKRREGKSRWSLWLGWRMHEYPVGWLSNSNDNSSRYFDGTVSLKILCLGKGSSAVWSCRSICHQQEKNSVVL